MQKKIWQNTITTHNKNSQKKIGIEEGTAASCVGSFVVPACSPNQPLPQLSLEEAFVSRKAKVY